MNITEMPIDMYSSATDWFGITESYSKKPDNLPNPVIIKVMPKINMIYLFVECIFNTKQPPRLPNNLYKDNINW